MDRSVGSAWYYFPRAFWQTACVCGFASIVSHLRKVTEYGSSGRLSHASEQKSSAPESFQAYTDPANPEL